MKLRAMLCILLTVILSTAFPLNCTAVGASGALPLSAKSAILIDLDERQILYQKNANERLPMASTTKIVTALVACELLECDTTVRIPREAVGIEGSSVYLCEGELLTVEELLYALLLESANDAAVALAIAAAGSIEDFAQKCNEKAYTFGLCNTNFTNPHGLYDEEHYTTAYDLAVLTSYALKNPTVSKICASVRAEISLGKTPESPLGEGSRYLKNHNKMLSRYDGAIGVKTGFTKKSGRCLISAAKRDGLTLIAVTLNAPDDWRDHTTLLDFGFEHFERKTLFDTGEFYYDLPLSNAEVDFVRITNVSPITFLIRKGTTAPTTAVECHFRFAVAPVSEGQILGRLCVSAGEKSYFSSLIANNPVNAKQEKHLFFN